jgi:chemotaxis protein methyltransferase CheR
MKGSVDRRDLDRFRAVIVVWLGLHFDDSRLAFLGEVLRRRLDQLGRPSHAYLDDLEQKLPANEINVLARELTVCETYFFRNVEQFRALAEVALPECMRARKSQGTLRLLSAGCASGEEAYSIAIVARETITDPTWDIQVQAVDVNPTALEKAVAARYSPWALRDTPVSRRRRWFRPDGRGMLLDETLRQSVRIGLRNLVRDDAELWPLNGYDVIFCRNVLMYFAPEQMRLTVQRIARSLAPGGFLFLGHAETLRGVSDAFHLRHTHGTFYYQRREDSDAVSSPVSDSETSADLPPSSIATFDETWVETIRAATERVASLVPLAPTGSAPRSEIAWDSTTALDLLQLERFTDALENLRSRPYESEHDPDTLLVEAALLVQTGQLATAEATCRRLIVIDELNSGAHYLLALCREHVGDLVGAGEYDRIAAYLDPTFAMPRLHLGFLARRAGDAETARRELGHALILLKREEASRIMLFGGGFSRNALITLYESVHQGCEGRR